MRRAFRRGFYTPFFEGQRQQQAAAGTTYFQSLTGALGGFSGTCATAATFLKSLAGSLGGFAGGFAGSLTTVFIQASANAINILQRLRKRGDL